jgi:hypothetical protein
MFTVPSGKGERFTLLWLRADSIPICLDYGLELGSGIDGGHVRIDGGHVRIDGGHTRVDRGHGRIDGGHVPLLKEDTLLWLCKGGLFSAPAMCVTATLSQTLPDHVHRHH